MEDVMEDVIEAPVVSIVIVNYKAYDELLDCLASLEGDAASGRVEIVVVDNGSTARVEDVKRRFGGVAVEANRANPGFAAGVNQGARRARGRYLLLLNPDAVLRSGAVDALAAYLAGHPDVAIAGARVLDVNGALQRSARGFPDLLTGLFGRTSLLTRLWPGNRFTRKNLVADETTNEPMAVDWVAGSCMMIRSDVFAALGGMDDRFFLYWEDADFCLRAKRAGWRCAYVPAAVAVHQVGRSSRHASTRSTVAFHRSAFRYYRKHGHPLGMPIAGLALTSRAALRIAAAWLARARAR